MLSEPQTAEAAVNRLRAICESLLETTERLSHGSPSFFVQGKRCFVMFVNDHHGDGNMGVWCAASEGVQQSLIEEAPEWFFKPPYVGHRGWIGIRMDSNLNWEEFEEFVLDAYSVVAPAKLLTRLAENKS